MNATRLAIRKASQTRASVFAAIPLTFVLTAFLARVAAGDPLFAAPFLVYGTGGYAASVVIGDLNGDGSPDLVTTSHNVNAVSVLLGNSDGTFGPKSDFETGSAFTHVAIGDLNGDGRPDLATANPFPSTVSVLLGNGDGTFGPKSDYVAGDTPSSVAIGDLNGDGNLDLATANNGSNTVSVLLGNADGTFGGRSDYGAGCTPNSVAIGDLNADGNPDLVTANDASTVSVLLGNGDGTFAPKSDFGTGISPTSVVIADLDGDGKPDLSMANRSSTAVSALLGKGDGTFGPSSEYGTGGASSVAVGDLNGDGDLDLAVAAWSVVSVLFGNGDGTFGPLIGCGPSGSSWVAFGDLSGDGRLDLAVAGSGVWVLLGNGDGTLGRNLGNEYATGNYPTSVAIADLDGDGKPDLAVANVGAGPDYAGTISVLLGNGDGTFRPKSDFGTDGFPQSMAIGDLNGDGKPDLVTVGYGSSSRVSVLLGNGDGSLEFEGAFDTRGYPTSVAIGDLNGDGKLDLATTSDDFSSPTVSVLLGNGDGTFEPRSDFGTGSASVSVAIGDLSGDGKPDLAVALIDPGGVSVLLGTGDGTFGPNSDYTGGGSAVSVAIGDVNGDGRPDLATSSLDDFYHTVSVLLGNGDGTFGSRRGYGSGDGSYQVAIGDLNGDGKLDLAATYSAGVSVMLGNGDGTFGPNSDYGTRGVYALPMAIGDLNRDGKPDVAVAGQRDPENGMVTVLLNIGTPPNTNPDCGQAHAVPAVITRHNHHLVPTHVEGVSDADGDPVTITVTRVTQDEPLVGHHSAFDDDEGEDDDAPSTPRDGGAADVEGRGDHGDHPQDGKNRCPDAVIDPSRGVQVRAERSKKGNGRVYSIWFTASDGRGGSCDGSVQVCVPRNRRHLACVDDGQDFNSLGPCRSGRDRGVVGEVTLTVGARSGSANTLAYSLPAAGEVLIAVYDILGRRVATLEHATQSAGVHEARWNTKGVARGIYFYRLQAGAVTLKKSVLVLE